MAEATDRPQASTEQASTDAVMTGDQYATLAPPVTEKYQPLSLLALAGFGIAAAYTGIVMIGGAVALFGRIPWLMPYWTFLIPVAAVVVCGAARTRIRNSEGTLSGVAFTTWGSRLAVLFGLTYAAYYAFTFFAVRLQAFDCADRLFEQIKQGHLEQAFLQAQGNSTKGMSQEELRTTVESRFNQPRGRAGSVGAFTRFRQDLFVRFVEMDGENATVTPRGVSDWEYKDGGYRVILSYHIATSLIEFDAKVETFGREPKPGEPKGRQWQVSFAGGVVSILPDSKRMTGAGEIFMLRSLMAQNFASEWVNKVNDGLWKDAYVDTLKPSERERARKETKTAKLDPGAELSKLIALDDKTFWAGKQQREELKQRILNTFRPGHGGRPTFTTSLFQQSVPIIRQSGKGIEALFDVGFYYLDERSGTMGYMAEGRLVVSVEDEADADRTSNWLVKRIEFDTGRSPPAQTMQRTPPPPQGGQEARPRP